MKFVNSGFVDLKKRALAVFGYFFLVLAAIGVALPIMPTAPFVIVAAACFAIANPAMYLRLRENRYFGEYVRAYGEKKGISDRARNRALALLWASLCGSMLLLRRPLIAIVMCVVGICVSVHLVMLNRRERERTR